MHELYKIIRNAIAETAIEPDDGDFKINIADGGIDFIFLLGWLIAVEDMARLATMTHEIMDYLERNGFEPDEPFRIETESINGTDYVVLKGSLAYTTRIVRNDETDPGSDDGGD